MKELTVRKGITNREEGFERYLQDVRQEERIDSLEEVELAQRIRQ
jgi:hypothetical protein